MVYVIVNKLKPNYNYLNNFLHHWSACLLMADMQKKAGLIRADLAAQGNPIGPNDLVIAATARTFDTVLVTNNTEDFARIIGLRVVDWEKN